MFGLNTTELIVILIIALVVFGPNKLPMIGSAVGKSIREFKKSLAGDEAREAEENAKTTAKKDDKEEENK